MVVFAHPDVRLIIKDKSTQAKIIKLDDLSRVVSPGKITQEARRAIERVILERGQAA